MDEIFNLAFAAPLTIGDVLGDIMRAIRILKASRQEEQYVFRLYSRFGSTDPPIIKKDDEPRDASLLLATSLTDQNTPPSDAQANSPLRRQVLCPSTCISSRLFSAAWLAARGTQSRDSCSCRYYVDNNS